MRLNTENARSAVDVVTGTVRYILSRVYTSESIFLTTGCLWKASFTFFSCMACEDSSTSKAGLSMNSCTFSLLRSTSLWYLKMIANIYY